VLGPALETQAVSVRVETGCAGRDLDPDEGKKPETLHGRDIGIGKENLMPGAMGLRGEAGAAG
jgi:hypothetical protein